MLFATTVAAVSAWVYWVAGGIVVGGIATGVWAYLFSLGSVFSAGLTTLATYLGISMLALVGGLVTIFGWFVGQFQKH